MSEVERWGRVKQMFQAALDRPPAERTSFVHEACGEDAALRVEVESLLAAHQQAGSFAEQPAVVGFTPELSFSGGLSGDSKTKDSLVGTQISHYRVLERIGQGGMGVVYRASDQRLDREVALKVLSAGSLENESARRRFRREAQALSKVNHPNVGTLYEFDSQEDRDFLVMEFIAGETLAEKLSRGPLPEEETIRLGGQIAEALVQVHEMGIVHHDLKPGNIMVTPKGHVKVFDFGLARLILPKFEEMATSAAASESHVVAGTLPYMAPEQLNGGQADLRSDVYGAGAVLYEMTTGRRMFEENQIPPLINAILNRAPRAPREVQLEISPAIERIIMRSIDKDPQRRYQTAQELLADLQRLSRPAASVQGPGQLSRNSQRRRSAAIAACVLVVAFAGGLWLARNLPFGTQQRTIQSIAVLPVKNLSGDPAQEFFADGMTDTLIMYLAQIRTLRVTPRTSVMLYKTSTKTLAEIGSELKVDGVVEGSVYRSGDLVRITAKLIRVPSEQHVWTDSYDWDLRNVLILKLYSEVAQTIASEIKIQVTPQEQVRLASAPTKDPLAYEDYLQGRFSWAKRTPSDLNKAIDYFQRAVGRDSQYALAYSGLADSYILLSAIGYDVLRPRDAIPKAMDAAARAVAIDDHLAEAHASLGYVKLVYDWNLPFAERELKRAIELNPLYATGHQLYSYFLSAAGRPDEALAELRKAQDLDPNSLSIKTTMAQALYFARRYDEMIEQCHRVLELEPNYFLGHLNLGRAYEQKGDYAGAIREQQTTVALTQGHPVGQMVLAHAYALAGQKDKAQNILSQLQHETPGRYVPRLYVAAIYLGLGQKEEAIQALSEACSERTDYLIYLNVDPLADKIRGEPGFERLTQCVGLPRHVMPGAQP